MSGCEENLARLTILALQATIRRQPAGGIQQSGAGWRRRRASVSGCHALKAANIEVRKTRNYGENGWPEARLVSET